MNKTLTESGPIAAMVSVIVIATAAIPDGGSLEQIVGITVVGTVGVVAFAVKSIFDRRDRSDSADEA